MVSLQIDDTDTADKPPAKLNIISIAYIQPRIKKIK
jgi:hypothetical protein